MRWYGQLAVIAVLGGAGTGGYLAYKNGQLQKLPVVGDYVAKLAPAPTPGGMGPGGPGGRPPPKPVVDVDAVRTGRIVDTREAVGTVRAYESITVTAKMTGIVETLSFEEGRKVNAGDVLAMLNTQERKADIEQAVAEIRRAEALRAETHTRLERAIALRRTGAGTEAQVADLTAQIRTLDSAITSAEAKRKATEARLEDLVVRASFAGRLGTRAVSLGAYVSPGTKITTLDDLSRVRLDFAVPENLLGQLKPGQVVRARSPAFGARAFEGKVSVIDPRVDAVTRTARLTAEFDNPDEALRPGMFLSVALEVSAKDDAVVVPEEAVVGEGLRHLIYTVQDGVVDRRVVRIGQRQGALVEIVEGLRAGETIVVRGIQRVRPGLPVEAKPVAPEAASAPAVAGETRSPERPAAPTAAAGATALEPSASPRAPGPPAAAPLPQPAAVGRASAPERRS